MNADDEERARKAFGKRLQAARKLNGLSQPTLATLCGWEEKNQSRISMYETGKRWPSPLEVKLLADLVGATPAHLLYGDKPANGGESSGSGLIAERQISDEERALIYKIRELPVEMRDTIRELVANSHKIVRGRRSRGTTKPETATEK